ncbi:MAG: (d)CMP kinase [Myxococcota bacterium]
MGVVVAIDGPAGAGKSTVARAVADQLGFTRVDTGAIYRCVTLLALERGLEESAALADAARRLNLDFEGTQVSLEGRDVTRAIRSSEVTGAVSGVSAVPEVRAALLETQRRLAREHPRGAVLEGRDIGTVVFPDADVKVFLTASDEERARRRHAELVAGGSGETIDLVLESIRRRDALDAGRAVAPLVAAEDATVVDSTGLSQAEVVHRIVSIVRQKVGEGRPPSPPGAS